MPRVQALASVREGLVATPSRVAFEGITQTFKKGALLVPSTGNLIEASANPRSIVGIAEEAGKNNAAAGVATVRYVPCIPGILFAISVDKASGLGRATLAADQFSEFGITKDSDGTWYLDIDKTTGGTNTVAVVVSFLDPVGTISGRVLAAFLMEVMFQQTA